VAKRQLLEQVAEEIVNLAIVLMNNFPLESVQLIKLGSLVVASAHEEVLWVANLPREHGHNDFH